MRTFFTQPRSAWPPRARRYKPARVEKNSSASQSSPDVIGLRSTRLPARTCAWPMFASGRCTGIFDQPCSQASALGHVGGNRLSRAAISTSPSSVRYASRKYPRSQMRAATRNIGLRVRPFHAHHLERETRRRRQRVGHHVRRPLRDAFQNRLLVAPRSSPIPRRTRTPCPPARPPAPSPSASRTFSECRIARQPERNAQFAQLLEVHAVALPINRLARSFSCNFPRGGALWPPAVGPSTTKPSTFPFAFLSIVKASVFDAMMARNFGRASAADRTP